MTVATSFPMTAATFTPPPSQAQVDRHGRTFDYPGMVPTDRRHLRCLYGLPDDGIPPVADHKLLRTDEILPLIAVSANLNGSVRKYLTQIGG